MRYLLILAFSFLVASCNTTKPGTEAQDTSTYVPPTELEGQRYDPTNSPEPMTAATPLPVPPGAEPAPSVATPTTMAKSVEQPQAYGNPPTTETTLAPGQEAYAPTANTAPANPPTYQAPQTYQSPQVYQTPQPYQAGTTAVDDRINLLQGQWANTADAREVVEFTPTHYQTYYDGQLLVEEDMIYHPECPGDCSGGISIGLPCFTISGPAQTDCYGVVRLTAEVLELSLLGVSTETIVYRRLQ